MTRRALQQKTILVVDDESSDQFLIQRAFSHLSPEFDLQVVETAEDAVRYLEGKEPYQDRGKYPLPVLVLLDLRLPGMSGLDLLKWIRQQSYLKELAIIALTAYGNRELPARMTWVSIFICLNQYKLIVWLKSYMDLAYMIIVIKYSRLSAFIALKLNF
ncbi:response regulator [Scytonema sp. PRP1]|uniref:response regulator n=1 Tax=Scytonema sp. PRP1 TaxID=3120513 RepID=UPI00300D4DC8